MGLSGFSESYKQNLIFIPDSFYIIQDSLRQPYLYPHWKLCGKHAIFTHKKMDTFRSRIDNFIYDSWKVFAHKAGNQLITINSVASMQMNYAYLLKKHLDFIIYDKKEKIDIELEHAQLVNKQYKSIDILLKTSNGRGTSNIPITLRYYSLPARAKVKKEASDIFKKEIYTGLELLEQCANLPHFAQGYELIMTNVKSLVYAPQSQSAKQNDYNISKGFEINEGIQFKSSKKNQQTNITLKKSYRFEWHQHGSFWFSLLQGI